MRARNAERQMGLYERTCVACSKPFAPWEEFVSARPGRLFNEVCRRCARNGHGSRSRDQSGLDAPSIPLRRLPLTSVPYPRGVERSRTRADCVDGPRPCPWISCRYHLLLDVHGDSVRVTVPEAVERGVHLEVMRETCALDVAGRGEHSLEETGQMLNLTIERVRQVQEVALEKLREEADTHDVGDYEPEGHERMTGLREADDE